MKALLAVNVQRDHVDGAWPVPGAQDIIAPLNKALEQFPLCIANKKWHPKDHLSFAENHPGSKPGDQIAIDHMAWTLRPTHCVAGTPGSDFAAGLRSELFETVFRTCIYPDFEDGGAFSDKNNENSTALDAYLLGRGVIHLYIAGLPLETGVLETALNAVHSIRHTYVIKDLVRPHDPALAEGVFQVMSENNIRLVSLEEALAAVTS